MTKLSWLKKSLQQHKTLFQTVSWVVGIVAAIGAIMISIKAYEVASEANRIALQANQLAAYETTLKQLEQLPFFHFALSFDQPDLINSSREQIAISNIGPPIREFLALPTVLLRIVYKCEDQDRSYQADIHVLDYYNRTLVANDPVGVLRTFENTDLRKVLKAMYGVRWLAEENNISVTYVGIDRYMQIQYQYLLEGTHMEFYHIRELGAYRPYTKISEREWHKADLAPILVACNDLSPEMLYQKLLKAIELNKWRKKLEEELDKVLETGT